MWLPTRRCSNIGTAKLMCVLTTSWCVYASAHALDFQDTSLPVAQWVVDSVRGDDTASGRDVSSPFRTLDRARDAVREWRTTVGALAVGGVRVLVRGGEYQPLALSAVDSGDGPDRRVTWSAWPGESPVISAGVRVPPSALSTVPHPMRPAAPPVLRADLAALNLTASDFGALSGASASGIEGCEGRLMMEAYMNGSPLLLARHPNPFPNGTWRWMHVNGAPAPPPPRNKPAPPGSTTSFVWRESDDAAVSGWADETDPWVQGYFQFDWTDSISRVTRFDAANHTVFLDPSTPTYGSTPIRPAARWLGLNLLSELDDNEYWLDRVNGTLYIAPPKSSANTRLHGRVDGRGDASDSSLSSSPDVDVVVSVAQHGLTLTNVAYVSVQGLAVMYSQGEAVLVVNATGVSVSDCTVSNVGTMGINISGVEHTITGNEVHHAGCAGMVVTSGHRATLTAGNSTVSHNVVHDYGLWKRMYQPGIAFDSVGDVYSHNTFFSSPHSGMIGHADLTTFGPGNNFTFLCTESGDAGAWYSGRSWADRGNSIVGNHFERIRNYGPPIPLQAQNVHAIHFDDQMSGYTVRDNTFVDSWVGIMLGGGRRTIIVNNTFERVDRAIEFDNRGMGWQKSSCTPPNGTLFVELTRDRVDQPPWSDMFPYLQHIAEDRPCVPVYNNVSHNMFCRCGIDITASPSDIAAWGSVAVGNINTTTC